MIAIANEKFWKDVRKLNNRQVLQDIVDAIENVQNAANSQDIRELKRLKGQKLIESVWAIIALVSQLIVIQWNLLLSGIERIFITFSLRNLYKTAKY